MGQAKLHGFDADEELCRDGTIAGTQDLKVFLKPDEVIDQRCLSDSCWALDQDDLRATRTHQVQRRAESRQFVLRRPQMRAIHGMLADRGGRPLRRRDAKGVDWSYDGKLFMFGSE